MRPFDSGLKSILAHPSILGLNAAAICLCIFTWLLFAKVDRYEDLSAELLQNPSFAAGLAGWEPSGNVNSTERETIDLSNWSASEGHWIRQALPKPPSGIVRLRADASVVNVVRGPEDWQSARIGLVGKSEAGDWRWDFPATLFAETGTRTLTDVAAIIRIPQDISEIRVDCELVGGTGGFFVERVSVKEARMRFLADIETGIILAGWAVLGWAALRALIRGGLWVPAATLLLVALLLLLIPDAARLWMLSMLARVIPPLDVFSPDHVLLFGLATGAILPAITPGRSTFDAVWSLATFAIAAELLQYFTPHRTPAVVDGLSSILGVLLAAGAVTLYRAIRGARSRGRGVI